tara:strand:+ start:374 stop:1126 length:753 start_codon:yes stop_codon:yes gene_type:complete
MEMSDNETTKVTDEEGNTWFEAIDGKRYKTRSGAWKRTQKLRAEGEVTEEPLQMPNDEPPVATEENPDFEGPEWAAFDMGDIPEGVQVIPSALKKVRRHGVKGRKRSKAEIEQEKQTNHSILKMGYRTGDYLMTRYGRASLVDPEFIVTHTEEDYDWISGITYAFLEDRGVNLAVVIGPGAMAGIANAYWFGKPISEINKKADKSPLRAAGKKIGGLKKWFRLPKFFRRKKKPEDSTFGGEWDASTGLEP